MLTRTAPTEAIATHGVVDIAPLHLTPKNTSGGGQMWVGASCAKAEVATVDESRRQRSLEAETRVDRDGVQVNPCVPALETEHVCTMRWGVASVEAFCGRALIKCVRKGGTRNLDLPGDIVLPTLG
jgi:hypothetical protein